MHVSNPEIMYCLLKTEGNRADETILKCVHMETRLPSLQQQMIRFGQKQKGGRCPRTAMATLIPPENPQFQCVVNYLSFSSLCFN